jgi:hypothetical protein
MDYRYAWFAERPAVHRLDLLNWLDQRQPERSQEKSVLKLAPASVIEDVITTVYDEAEVPPNINQLPKAVIPRLNHLGFKASGKQIKELGRANKFAARRGPVGKRRT